MSNRLLVALVSLAGALALSCGSSGPSYPSGTSTAGGSNAGSSYGGNPGSSSPGATADLVITIQGNEGGMSFSPAAASLKAGQTVAWRTADVIGHRVVPDGAGGWDTGVIGSGQTSAPATISAAGSYPYHCSIHPGMVGSLTAQ